MESTKQIDIYVRIRQSILAKEQSDLVIMMFNVFHLVFILSELYEANLIWSRGILICCTEEKINFIHFFCSIFCLCYQMVCYIACAILRFAFVIRWWAELWSSDCLATRSSPLEAMVPSYLSTEFIFCTLFSVVDYNKRVQRETWRHLADLVG